MRTLKTAVLLGALFGAREAKAQSAETPPEVVQMPNVATGAAAPTPPVQPSEGAPGAAAAPAAASPPPPPQEEPNIVAASNSSVSGPMVAPSVPSKDWKFDFHGYFRAPLRIGMGHDDKPAPGQATQTIHTPVVPDDQYFNWQYTSVQSMAWAEAFLSYGNSIAKGTLGFQGYNFTDSGWTQSNAQFGIAQGYLTLTPSLGYKNVRFEANVGSFWGKYGMAGKYDAGKYDTYLFGRTHLMGESVKMEIDVGRWTLWGEEGFGGKTPDPNKFNDAKFSLAVHGHAGLKYGKKLAISFHSLYSWTSEEDLENSVGVGLPDGSIAINGADVAIRNTFLGELYLGYSRIGATNATTVDDGIEVIHSGGGGEFGYGIKTNYLDGPKATSRGNGTINTVLAQYEFSFSNFLAGMKGKTFSGDGPDIYAAVFGMVNTIKSDDPDMDGVMKLKWGVDSLITPIKWFGVGFRTDRVQPNSKIPEQSFALYSPRIVFKTAWVTHEEVMIQYSRYDYNDRTCPAGDTLHCAQHPTAPYLPYGFGAAQPANDPQTRGAPTTTPDINVFKLQGTMWW